ncbi:MAG: hypothetical protein J0M13_20290 [Candidatus Accumulibacter sp.]|nr:hypothetical protein [Candidatus Accumulibacter necessarius]MBN8455093.1 hypothetical protein [Accumulibacter sp.]
MLPNVGAQAVPVLTSVAVSSISALRLAGIVGELQGGHPFSEIVLAQRRRC